MKRVEKEKAIVMRKEGASLKTISERLGIAKSSVSLWVRGLELSEEVQKIITDSYTNGQKAAQASKRARTEQILRLAKAEAESSVNRIPITADLALVCCALLYWCEGSKRLNDSELCFTNSDPLLVGLYLG